MTIEEFERTILPLKHQLYRWALFHLRQEEEAKDVVQDVMLKVWRDREAMAAVKNPAGWCMRMCRNLALDRLKSRSRGHQPLEGAVHLRALTPDPAAVSEQQDLLQNVERLMGELPQVQQELLRLRDMEGYSYEEIEDILSLHPSKVKVYLFRARKAIREKLKKMTSYGLHQG